MNCRAIRSRLFFFILVCLVASDNKAFVQWIRRVDAQQQPSEPCCSSQLLQFVSTLSDPPPSTTWTAETPEQFLKWRRSDPSGKYVCSRGFQQYACDFSALKLNGTVNFSAIPENVTYIDVSQNNLSGVINLNTQLHSKMVKLVLDSTSPVNNFRPILLRYEYNWSTQVQIHSKVRISTLVRDFFNICGGSRKTNCIHDSLCKAGREGEWYDVSVGCGAISFGAGVNIHEIVSYSPAIIPNYTYNDSVGMLNFFGKNVTGHQNFSTYGWTADKYLPEWKHPLTGKPICNVGHSSVHHPLACDFHSTELVGGPLNWEYTPEIRKLHLYDNQFSGSVDLTHMSKFLIELWIFHNEFSGAIDLRPLGWETPIGGWRRDVQLQQDNSYLGKERNFFKPILVSCEKDEEINANVAFREHSKSIHAASPYRQTYNPTCNSASFCTVFPRSQMKGYDIGGTCLRVEREEGTDRWVYPESKIMIEKVLREVNLTAMVEKGRRWSIYEPLTDWGKPVNFRHFSKSNFGYGITVTMKDLPPYSVLHLEDLPAVIIQLDVSNQKLVGKLDMSTLHPRLLQLHVFGNRFNGTESIIDFTKLPFAMVDPNHKHRRWQRLNLDRAGTYPPFFQFSNIHFKCWNVTGGPGVEKLVARPQYPATVNYMLWNGTEKVLDSTQQANFAEEKIPEQCMDCTPGRCYNIAQMSCPEVPCVDTPTLEETPSLSKTLKMKRGLTPTSSTIIGNLKNDTATKEEQQTASQTVEIRDNSIKDETTWTHTEEGKKVDTSITKTKEEEEERSTTNSQEQDAPLLLINLSATILVLQEEENGTSSPSTIHNNNNNNNNNNSHDINENNKRLSSPIAEVFSESVAEGITVSTSSSAIASAAFAPTKGAQALRVAKLSSVARCDYSSTEFFEPSRIEHPFYFPVNLGEDTSSQEHRYICGAAITSSSFVFLVYVLQIVLWKTLQKEGNKKDGRSKKEIGREEIGGKNSLDASLIELEEEQQEGGQPDGGKKHHGKKAKAKEEEQINDKKHPFLRFYSFFSCAIVMYFATSIPDVCLVLILHAGGNSLQQWLGVGSLFFFTLVSVHMTYLLVWDFGAVEISDQGEEEEEVESGKESRKTSNIIASSILSATKKMEFCDGKEQKQFGWATVWEAYFEGARTLNVKMVRLYTLTELYVSVLVGVGVGIRPGPGAPCISVAAAIIAITIPYCIYLYRFRPYRTKLDSIFAYACGFLQLCAGICCLLAVLKAAKNALAVLGWISFVQSNVLWANIIATLGWEYLRKQRKAFEEKTEKGNKRKNEEEEEMTATLGVFPEEGAVHSANPLLQTPVLQT